LHNNSQTLKKAATVKVKINDDEIAKYALQKHVKKLKDNEVPQLYYHFSNCREAGTFWAVFRVSGFKNSKWFKLGPRKDITPGKARLLAKRMIQEKCYRSCPDLVKAARYGKFNTVSKLLTWYKEHIKTSQLGKGRKVQINSYINNHLAPYFKDKKIPALSVLVVDEFSRELATKLKISTARKVLGLLFSVLKEANRLRLVDFDPCVNMTTYQFYKKSSSEKNGREGRLNMSMLPHIFKRLHDHPHIKSIALVQLTFLTWGRIGEYSQAKWSDWDQLDGTLKVKAKGGKEHLIYTNPIIDDVLTTLQRAYKTKGIKSTYIFTHKKHKNTPMCPNSASKVVRRFAKDNWSAHDVRKFSSTWAMENKVDYHVSQWLLAHEISDLDSAYFQTQCRDSCTQTLHSWANVLLELGLLSRDKAARATLARNRKALRQKLPHIMRDSS